MDGSPLPVIDSMLAGVAPRGGPVRVGGPPDKLATSNDLREQQQLELLNAEVLNGQNDKKNQHKDSFR